MGSYLDGTLFVIDAAKGRRRLVRLGRETLARSGTKTLGAVLNRVPPVTRFGYGGFYGRLEDAQGAGVVDVITERRAVERASDLPKPQTPSEVPLARKRAFMSGPCPNVWPTQFRVSQLCVRPEPSCWR